MGDSSGLADWDREVVQAATSGGPGSVAKIRWRPQGRSGSSAGLKLQAGLSANSAPALGGLAQGLRKLPKSS